MPSFRSGRVTAIRSARAGLQRVDLTLDDGTATRAYNLTELTGLVAVDDEVVCNTTAVELGLGTGGWHVVHWNLSRRDLTVSGGGHIMKLRYSSLQTNTGSAEEHHPDLPADIGGIPVVACSLHSQVGVVAAAFASVCPGRRLAYVMTDGAALPLALSDLVVSLESAGLLCGTVTAGHSFGGTHEAVNVISALTVARGLLDADAIVVGMGPGVVGTGTALGHTAIEQAGIIHDTVNANGRSIACLRVSSGDERERHRGLSHHTATALGLVRPETPFAIAVPLPERGEELVDLSAVLRPGRLVEAMAVADPVALLETFGLAITTMGRGPAEDRAFFRFAAAAGLLAATMVA